MLIDGKWVESGSGATVEVLDPSKGRPIERVPSATIDDVRSAIDAAKSSFNSGVWSRAPPAERANALLRVASLLEADAQHFADLETLNAGKTIKQTTTYDLPYTVDNIRYIAGMARRLDGDAMAEYVPGGTSAIRREPIGVVGVITPWNYPLMMVVWRAFPALATGNSVVIKPASYTPLTTIRLGSLLLKSGIPDGVFNIVTGPGSLVGEELAKNNGVDMIAFTGSTEVGARLSELASPTTKKVSLELGGKAPFIVLADADLEASAQGAVVGGLVNNGQDCANSTRYYVEGSVLEKFQKALVEKLQSVKVGDPLDPSSDMGPLISAQHRERVLGFIKKGQEEGGSLVMGGRTPKIAGHEGGFFLEPTLIYTENHDSTIIKDEIFGPVFSVFKISSLDEAIQRGNDVIYGLGASVWTKDITKAMKAVRDLRFGTVWVNDHVPVPSEMPWAGYKQSGHGASLSRFSLDEYTYIKHVYFDLTGAVRKSWHYSVFGQKD
ncbi:MAG: aldehyde dehydrogenase family protein [Thaumarchaeota archaeon]|nr:aldehyde dehydrogenase family protein [Nitrososphaerota archaeon]